MHISQKGRILGPWGHVNKATTNWSIVKLILYIYNKQTSSVKFLSFKDLKIHQLCTNANASHIGFSSVAREMLHTNNTRVNANSSHTTLLSNTLTELQVYWYLAKIQESVLRESSLTVSQKLVCTSPFKTKRNRKIIPSVVLTTFTDTSRIYKLRCIWLNR